MINKKNLGLYEKFVVTRTDNKHLPGEKHEHCKYFVLDLNHDKHAPAAIAAYAESCKDEYPALATDLRSWLVKDGKRIEGYDSYAFAEKFEIANPVAPTAAVDANVMDKNTSNHPQKCPVTGRDFFLVIDHPILGNVATYGGPYDSYTIPEWNGEEFRSERFDHDTGEWVEGGEPYPFILVDESEFIKMLEAAS
jgi:hypothetical protein